MNTRSQENLPHATPHEDAHHREALPEATLSMAVFASVVVSTRNRGALVVDTIHSLLANTYAAFEVIVIDQSTNDATEQALVPLRADPRLVYVRSQTHGLSRSRNEGLALAHGSIVAMTDDDCVTPEAWLATIVAQFARDTAIGMVFCDVLPGECDALLGMIPAYELPEDQIIANIPAWRRTKRQTIGLGASMAVRRDVARELGGFDAMLGAGAPFNSAEDFDLPLRMLIAGYAVACCKASYVVHYGFRTWAETRSLYLGYAFGPMVTYAKLVRSGHWNFVLYFLHDVWHTTVIEGLRLVLQRRKPAVIGRLLAMLSGFSQGLRAPLDTRRLLFVEPGDVRASVSASTHRH